MLVINWLKSERNKVFYMERRISARAAHTNLLSRVHFHTVSTK